MAGIDASIPLAALGQQHPIDPFSVAQSLSSMQLQRQNAASLQAEREAAIEVKNAAAEKARRAAADDDAFKAAIQSSAGMTPDAFLEHVRTTAPGSFMEVQKAVREAQDKAASAKKAAEEAAAAHSNAALHQQDYIGHLADQIQQSGYNPAVVNAALNMAVEQFPEWKDHAEQIRQIAATQGKEALAQAIASMQTPEVQKARNEAANAAAQTPGLIADAAVKQQVAAGTRNGMTPEQQAVEKDRAINRSVAQGNLSLAKSREQREQAKYDQTYGVGVSDTGQPLPENPRARAIAEYREPGMMGRAGTTGPGLALMQQVYKINPAYDASQFPARNKMRIAFTSGPQSQTLNSLNTAIEHLDQFADAAKDLGNGSFQPTNALKNWAKTIAGDSAPTNFEGIKTIMAGELASAFKKSGATDSEIEQVKASITGKQSPKQLTDYVTQIAIPALGSKAQTFQDQWRATMGEKDPFSVYTPGAQKVLQKHNAQPGGDTVKMRAPNGQTRDVASADVEHYKALGAVVIK